MAVREDNEPHKSPTSTSVPERLGDFRLLERLGAGGMGVVYLARQESLQRDVALKLILPEHLYFAEARERFHREVEAAGKLHHPGIVPVYSVGEEQGLPYFAMELVEGCSLATVIEELRARGPESLSGTDLRDAIARRARRFHDACSSGDAGQVFAGTWVQACCRILLQVAEALQHAHELGVVHRDVKPSNIIVTPAGRAMLLDFGLASDERSSRITRTGSHVGSLPYMPPERVRSGLSGADIRGDVYSLGVTFYELLALRLPFDSSTIQELLHAISSGEYQPLRERNPAVPWDASIVCATAMERDPARRYATAADLARDLRNLLELRPITARVPSPALRARRWIQRHPTTSVTSALGFLLLVVAPGVAWWRIKRERDVAVRELRTRNAMLEFMLGLFHGTDTDFGNPGDRTVYDLLDEGSKQVRESFADAPEIRAQLLLDLSILQFKLGRPRKALDLGREAYGLCRELYGEGDPFTGGAERDLAVTLLNLGEIEEGRRLLEEAQTVLQDDQAKGSMAALETEMDVAMAFLIQGRFAEARRVLEEIAASPTWERDAPAILRITWLGNMGMACRGLGEHDLTADYNLRAVELARATYGEVHETVARTLQDLAVSRLEAHAHEEALKLFLESRDIRAQLQSGESMDDARLEYNLGNTCSKLGRQAESAEHFGRALELSRKLSGDSAQTAKAATGQGSALVMAGRAADAEPVLREALELSRRFIPRKGHVAGDAPLTLARCLVALGRHQEAAPLYEELFQCIEGDPTVEVGLRARWETECADTLAALGRLEEAASHRERARQLLDAPASEPVSEKE